MEIMGFFCWLHAFMARISFFHGPNSVYETSMLLFFHARMQARGSNL
jgi:hypothetical protein